MPYPKGDNENEARIRAFKQELARLSWTEGGNIRFDGNCVREARTHALIHQHCFRPMGFPRALVPQYGRGSASHTQASLANHSCSVRQIGQWTRAKKTGMASKLLRSVVKPVGMSRPVCGHLTMTAPIGLSWLLSLRHSISPACEDRLT